MKSISLESILRCAGVKKLIEKGDIISKVIGTDVLCYLIYGKEVLIANKMESSRQVGMIKVSEDFKRFMAAHLLYDYLFENDESEFALPRIKTRLF